MLCFSLKGSYKPIRISEGVDIFMDTGGKLIQFTLDPERHFTMYLKGYSLLGELQPQAKQKSIMLSQIINCLKDGKWKRGVNGHFHSEWCSTRSVL